MQSSRNLIGIFIEFTTCTNFGHYHLQCRFLFFFVKIYRNTTTVITNRNPVSFMNGNTNRVTMSCQSLINRVIHHFVNQMVQTTRPNITDVHRWSHPYVLHPFQGLNTACCILFLTHNFCFFALGKTPFGKLKFLLKISDCFAKCKD